MGMKDVKNEPQSQLAGNLVSGPKDSAGNDYANLVSMPKGEGDAASVGSNLVSHKGGDSTVKNPG